MFSLINGEAQPDRLTPIPDYRLETEHPPIDAGGFRVRRVTGQRCPPANPPLS